jgi:hypothetical protein
MKEPTNISNKLTLLPREKLDELFDLLSQISLKRYIFMLRRKIICKLMVYALDNVEFHSPILKLIQDKFQGGNYTDQVIFQLSILKY